MITIDEPNNTIRIERTYATGVARVWWAWTDAAAISQWWGPQGWAATVYEMDVRPGGAWRFEIAPDDGVGRPGAQRGHVHRGRRIESARL